MVAFLASNLLWLREREAPRCHWYQHLQSHCLSETQLFPCCSGGWGAVAVVGAVGTAAEADAGTDAAAARAKLDGLVTTDGWKRVRPCSTGGSSAWDGLLLN